MRAAELRTVTLKFKDMLHAAQGGPTAPAPAAAAAPTAAPKAGQGRGRWAGRAPVDSSDEEDGPLGPAAAMAVTHAVQAARSGAARDARSVARAAQRGSS